MFFKLSSEQTGLDDSGEQDEVPHRRVVVIGPDGEGANRGFEAASLDIAACLKVVAAPSSFGAAAIARAIVLRCFRLFNSSRERTTVIIHTL